MELQHFSHEHPLILSEEKNDNGEEIVCNMCQGKISRFAYSCKNCLFFLHISCAGLPAEMKSPLHPDHPPLTLLPQAPYHGHKLVCDVCHVISDGFPYRCSLCDFEVDMRCAKTKIGVDHKIHKIHEHPLSPLSKPALFLCDACNTEHKGFSHHCDTCGFWVHEDCASLPTAIKHGSHNHPLTLSGWNKHKKWRCGICGENLNKHCWIYHCEGCRYALHLNCSIETRERKTRIDVKDEANTIRLPMTEGSVNLIAQFAEQISQGNKKKAAKLYHSSRESRDHPLTLFNDDLCTGSLNEHKTNDKICNACMGPISAPPFYNCGECSNFFLHKWCAELPKELKHPCHKYPLRKCCTLDSFLCRGCGNYSNGFSFQCDRCYYRLDVNCATLPSSIVHEVHDHPLLLRDNCFKGGCAACGDDADFDHSHYIFSYGCDTCNFNLHYKCALLPRYITHRYDEHPFILTYAPPPPPIKDDGSEEEYYCEFCEEVIDTNEWFYHCDECDQSACAKCFCKEKELFPRINSQITYDFGGHPHPLSLVQLMIGKNTLCDYCHKNIYREVAFRCGVPLRLAFRCGAPLRLAFRCGAAFRCAKCDIILDDACAGRATYHRSHSPDNPTG